MEKKCSSKALICIQDAQNSQWENLDRTVSNYGLRSTKETLLFVFSAKKKKKTSILEMTAVLFITERYRMRRGGGVIKENGHVKTFFS